MSSSSSSMRNSPTVPYLLLFLLPCSVSAQAQVNPRPKVGIAFEGGGALGLAHIGVLQWFEEHRIPIDYVAGTSMGGLVGGLYSMGMRPAEIRELVSKIDWNETLGGQVPFEALSFRRKEDQRAFQNGLEFGLRHGFSLPSALTSDKNITFLLDRQALLYSQLKSFDDLPIPFRCVATDLVTGKAFVFKDGPLGEALRATMSLPGVFSPVHRDGSIYADGGLMDNLPVEVVKQMGADVVIAVNLNIDPFSAERDPSLVTVLNRSISAMITVNERRSMDLADVVIHADLKGFTGGNYSLSGKIIAKGYEAAAEKSSALARFEMAEPAWRTYESARESRKLSAVATPEFVRVVGIEGALSRDIEKALAGHSGKPIDIKRLEEGINLISGNGRYYGFSYHMAEQDGRKGLVLRPHEKGHAPPIMNFGFLIDGSDVSNVRFSVNARITALDVGGYRSELRTDVSFGSAWVLASEYFKVLSPTSNWFIAPRAYATSSPFDLYDRSERLAEYRIREAGAGADFGYSFDRFSQLRMGYEFGHRDASLRVGGPVLPTPAGRVGISSVRYEMNRLDSPVIPRHGQILRARVQWNDANPGSKNGFPLSEMAFGVIRRISQPGSVFVQGSGGTTFGSDDTGIPQFFLGGYGRLGAYGRNELRTNQYWLGKIGYVHELFQLPPILGNKVYATATYEVAKAYGAPGSSRIPTDGAVGVVIETLIGPLAVGGSYGDTGHRRIYFSLGRFF
jgi:NTE family protein